MQEILEWVRATLPMDLDTSRMIEQKIESLLEKEKEVIMDAWRDGRFNWAARRQNEEDYYNKTFNTKEK